MNSIKNLLPLLLIVISSCNKHSAIEVKRFGEMEDLMKKGDMSTHFELNMIKDVQHVYGIGSVTNLKGFVVINDSHPFTSSVSGDSVWVQSSWSTATTLMLYARVDNWKEVALPESIKSWTDLETFIQQEAGKNDLDPKHPFPFLLNGAFPSINWRVSDWDESDKEVTNKKIKNAGLKGTAVDIPATIVGFYCTKPYEVLTEHTLKMHLHFISDDEKLSGHIDDLTLSPQCHLFFPAIESGTK